MQKRSIATAVPVEQWTWLKDHPEHSIAEHVRRALSLYIGQGGTTTKITVSTPEGERPYRTNSNAGQMVVVRKAPEIRFESPKEPERDPSTGEPVDRD